MITKKYLLTDFSEKPWNNVDMESVRALIPNLNKRANNDSLLGQVGVPESSLISLSNACFIIKKVYLQGNKIYGDVGFFDNEKGQQAFDLLEVYNRKLSMQAFGIPFNPNVEINQVLIDIFQWYIFTESNQKKLPKVLSKEDVLKYNHFLTVGELKKFLNEHDLPDKSPVMIQRIEDVYYENHNWGVFLKMGESANREIQWNNDIKSGKYLDKDEYPKMKKENLILSSEETIKNMMEQYTPAWSCVRYEDDKDMLFIDLHS